jgi:Lipocalin-like domain
LPGRQEAFFGYKQANSSHEINPRQNPWEGVMGKLAKRQILQVFLSIATGLISVTGAYAQDAKDLVGTWKFSSSVNIAPDGQRTTPMGANAIGRLIFDASGNFSFIKTNPDIPKFAANNAAQGTAEENRAVVIGAAAYFGTYSVSGKTLIQKIEGATYPNWRGTEQKVTITSLTSDEFRYSIGASKGGQVEAIWTRAK